MNWRLKNPERARQQNRRKAAKRLEKRVTTHTCLQSFLMKGVLPKKLLLKCLRFIRCQFNDFEERMVMPMKPMMCTARFNFRTPQAMRLFFAKETAPTINRTSEGDDSVERFFHGCHGLMSLVGPHPSFLGVLPIEGSLSTVLIEVLRQVERHLKVKTLGAWDGTVEFNSIN